MGSSVMIYKRHLIQFNNLVFDSQDMISEEDYSISFKESLTEYTFRHGSYAPYKKSYQLAEAGTVDITLYLEMKKLPCSMRDHYQLFVIDELTRPGKLWAVQGNSLLWTRAHIATYTLSVEARSDTLQADVTFTLPDGVWHKADKQRTFIVPFDICTFMDCYHYEDVQPCCTQCPPCCDASAVCDCCCDTVEKDQALCYFTDYQAFYARCGSGYRVITDCIAADKFFDYIGTRICGDCNVFGQLYSDTDLPTDNVTLTIHGSISDAKITINGNTNILTGDYTGVTTIYPDGTVTNRGESDLDDCAETLDVSVLTVPENNFYGWTINPRRNSVSVYTGDCGTVCVYFDVDAITI